MILSRKHPYLCFALGILIAGHKFPFNWLSAQDTNRKAAMQRSSFGLLIDETALDDGLVDAWGRIEGKIVDNDGKYGRLSHNLTNLVIEWTRRWIPYATKFLCALFCYGLDLWIIETIWRLI